MDPRALVQVVADDQGYVWSKHMRLERVTYYDARPDEDPEVDPQLMQYWEAVELLPDTHLGFGWLRGRALKKPPRQKGVDTLIAVGMLVGAFTRIYSTAILVAGDADFVPVVDEVQRRGAKVIVAAVEHSLSVELRRAADRFYDLGAELPPGRFPSLKMSERQWPTTVRVQEPSA